ncbi:MAG: class I SAM-dependent methyltransferase [Verrucomicrobiota bacterium]|jgi:2-polyprenyl-3-methyl-5-hydroxy-6-metoxy-1,4-benzoquinol methylase
MPEVRGKDWNQYWIDSANSKGLFEIIAKFYRRYIISPAVKHYIHRYFRDEPSRVYMHAGCGSAESDNQIRFTHARFVMLDISPEALVIARRKSQLRNVQFVCGDIFNPPFKVETFDGVWNLGVMEHFFESEIKKIFTALSCSVKSGGQLLIFWPPRYGLSVIVLTSFLSVVNAFRKTPLVLYPDEVSRFWTKKWSQKLVGPAGLVVVKSHFSMRDMFTYVVMVAKRSNPN